MKNALIKNADKGAYAPVSGISELREAISQYNKKYFLMGVDSKRIFVGPGTKELIFNLLEILHGTVILPTPAWLGYLPQIRFLRKNFHMLPVRANGKITPNDLEHLVLRLHDRQKILILNNPNNPTGLVYSQLELEELTDVCRTHNVLVISDEIYAQTTYQINNFVSMGKIYPEGTFVTNGLSKSHACGGYRLGYVIFPQHTEELQANFKKILATEYTATSTPIQHAAIAGFEDSDEIEEYFEHTRKIHQIMGDYTYKGLNSIEGVVTTKPEATFYLLANFNHYNDDFVSNKILTSQKFSESLMSHPYHTALVGGDSLVLERTDFRARIAFVDYDGGLALKNYRDNPPKTISDRQFFVEQNAPKIVNGIKMIEKFLIDMKKNSSIKIQRKNQPDITLP